MGMEKLGTKGPFFIATITLITKVLFELNSRSLDPYKLLDLEETTRKTREKTSLMK
jgi:hypothetical protein